MPITLDQFGDVLTDRELAQLLRRPASWPMTERYRAKCDKEKPDLPPRLACCKHPRYRKVDVARWLEAATMRQRKRARKGRRAS